MRSCRFIIIGVLVVCVAFVCAGCKEASQQKQPANERLVLEQGQIETIHPKAAGLKDIVYYDLMGVRNGVFYGAGYGPSGDGTCTNAFYTLDSEGSGSVMKSRKTEACMSMERVEYPDGSGIWYILQDAQGGMLNRIDYNTMQDEALLKNKLDPALRKTITIATPYTVDGQTLYYGIETQLFSQSLSDGKIKKLGDVQETLDGTRMVFIGNLLYIQDGDFCYSLNPADCSRKKCFKGDILGKSGAVIYFKWDKDSAGAKVFSYDTKDRETTQLIHVAQCDSVSMQDDQYIFVTMEGDHILALNLKKNRLYDIDTSAFTKIIGKQADFWYADDQYLYAQSICEWDVGERLPDRFFRYKWKD